MAARGNIDQTRHVGGARLKYLDENLNGFENEKIFRSGKRQSRLTECEVDYRTSRNEGIMYVLARSPIWAFVK